MTEQEWLSCDHPEDMLDFTTGKVSDRKLRLWVAAMCDMSSYDYSGFTNLHLWRKGEGGEPSGTVGSWCNPQYDKPGDPPMALRAALLRDVVVNPFGPAVPRTVRRLVKSVSYFATDISSTATSTVDTYEQSLAPWLTPDAISLAQAAWDDRLPNGTLASDRLAVLADALEEAGCVEQALLAHLRARVVCRHCEGAAIDPHEASDEETGEVPDCPFCDDDGTVPATHIRGCWALDLVLGKE